MKTFHDRPDAVPGFPRLPLRDPDQQQRQIAEKNVGPDPLLLAVIERSQVERRLQRSERPFHLRKLLVAERHVFGRKRIVGGREQVFAVQRLFLLNLGQVDPQLAGFRLPNESPHRAMRQEGADRLFVGLPRGIAQAFDRLLDLLKRFIARGLVLPGLFGIENQNEPSAAFPRADDDLLDLQVLPDFPEPPLERQGFLVNRLAIPQFLAQNVMAAGPLKDHAVFLARQAPVQDPDAATEPPTPKIGLDHLHRGHVLSVAGQDPTSYRKPLFGHGQPDHHLRSIRSTVLAVSVTAKIVLLALGIRRCCVEEQKIDLDVEKIGRRKKDFFLKPGVLSQKKIHGPVQMLQRDRLGVAQSHVFSHPVLDAALGIGRQSAVGDHGKDSPFDGGAEASLGQSIVQHDRKPEPFPELPQKMGAAHGPAPDESQSRRTAGCKSVLGGDKPAQALDQPSDGGEIERIGPAEGMKDFGPGESAFGVPDVMGELDISGDRSVFVFPGDGPNIHAYLYIAFYYACQCFISYSHAYAFLIFRKDLC